jgi:hypothetical protein
MLWTIGARREIGKNVFHPTVECTFLYGGWNLDIYWKTEEENEFGSVLLLKILSRDMMKYSEIKHYWRKWILFN